MIRFQQTVDADDLTQLEHILSRLKGRAAARPQPVAIDAEQWFALRRRRDAIFQGLNLFSEPAWDILLCLRIADGKGRRETVGSVSIAAGCPLTTASRHVAELVRLGLVAREEDATDARRIYLSLTGRGDELVKAALENPKPVQAGPFIV